ncbi:hypothetical protein Cgig2_003627 [Carnegiea gigantea]|uniref:R13L1/DRL21-like LRR repeat region domain-containing protein n=1 Tax=Carnegiea gigantea TaxID=171969 RepID=A0A9Q1QDH1_9CARY|nr:hypothetical protein Cgig2_003627 [Carnegiea gigantea]
MAARNLPLNQNVFLPLKRANYAADLQYFSYLKIFKYSNLIRSLKALIIYEVMHLTKVPQELTECASLQTLSIDMCEVGWLTGGVLYSGLPSGQYNELGCSFDISHLFRISSLGVLYLWGWARLLYLPDQLEHFTSLKVLHITWFDSLDTLPEWLRNFSSLEYLVLFNCNKLKKLPHLRIMKEGSSLKVL